MRRPLPNRAELGTGNGRDTVGNVHHKCAPGPARPMPQSGP